MHLEITDVADVVAKSIGDAQRPLLDRIAVLEQQLKALPAPQPGRDGLPGVPGPAGRDGERGPQGESGTKGLDGSNGTDGAEGRPGPSGPPGERGERGLDGHDGAPGLSGERGEIGPSGATGEKGDPGDRGEKGDPGDVGPVGSPGIAGPRGDKGSDGISLGLEHVQNAGEYDPETGIAAIVLSDGQTSKRVQFVFPGLVYQGIYEHGKTYRAGQVVTLDGSGWVALKDTSARPRLNTDDSRAWQLMIKSGSPGKAGAPGQKGDPGSMGPRGPEGPPGGRF